MGNEEVKVQPRYQERDISWCEFNRQIIQMSSGNIKGMDDSGIKVMEQLKFRAIADSNLKDFITVRYAKAKNRRTMEKSFTKTDMTNEELYQALTKEVSEQLQKIQSTRSLKAPIKWEFNNEVFKSDLKKVTEEILPSVNWIYVSDPKDTYITFKNSEVYLFVKLIDSHDEVHQYICEIPKKHRVFMSFEKTNTGDVAKDMYSYDVQVRLIDKMLVNSIVEKTKYELLDYMEFRVFRNYDILIDSKRGIVDAMQKVLNDRATSDIILIETLKETGYRPSKELLANIKEICKVPVDDDLATVSITKPYVQGGYGLGFSDIMSEVYDRYKKYVLNNTTKKSSKNAALLVNGFFPKLYPSTELKKVKSKKDINDMFYRIRQGGYVGVHPYDSYDSVVNFISAASRDKKVKAIRQTLYRVSKNSPIVAALCRAAKTKAVTVYVEVQARFDEPNNIKVGKKLEKAGCTVVYGKPYFKTHAKITEVSRKEQGKIVKYVHLGSGNYNDTTSKMYIDVSMITADEDIASDVETIFDIIQGKPLVTRNVTDEDHTPQILKKMRISPGKGMNSIHNAVHQLIRSAIVAAEAGSTQGIPIEEDMIIFKCNQLTETSIIDELYEAAEKGIEVRLFVRGACSILPREDLPNLHIYREIGRFLEHSRVYARRTKYVGRDEFVSTVYVSSADLMPRNLYRRIETMFPIESEGNKEYIWDELFSVYTLEKILLKQEPNDTDNEHVAVTSTSNEKTYPMKKFFPYYDVAIDYETYIEGKEGDDDEFTD